MPVAAVTNGFCSISPDLPLPAARPLAPCHSPQVLVLVDTLPRTAGTGKLQRVGYAAKIGLPTVSGTGLTTLSLGEAGLSPPPADSKKVSNAPPFP